MNDQVRCIVLKQIDFKEYDAIIKVLTKEYGKISFKATSIRKLSSKNASSLLPFTVSDIQFDYQSDKTIFRLKSAHTIQLFRYVHEDLYTSCAASIMVNIADLFSVDGNDFVEKKEVFDCLYEALDLLNKKYDTTIVLCLYLVDMMRIFGISAEVDGCARCGSQLVYTISSKEGGFLCQKHGQQENLKALSNTQLKQFRLVVKAGLKHIDAVVKTQSDYLEVLWQLEQMICIHGMVEQKTFALYNRLFFIE